MSRQDERKTAGGMMGRSPGMHNPVEKSKDFKGTWGKLIRYCKNYLPAIVIALILAAVGTVLQILGPDRLKDMTNEISKGLPSGNHKELLSRGGFYAELYNSQFEQAS